MLSCGLILTSFVACKNTSANAKAQSVAEQNIQTSEDEDATDINTYLSEYDITVEDIEYVANIFKQTNEGNDNGLISGEDYYEDPDAETQDASSDEYASSEEDDELDDKNKQNIQRSQPCIGSLCCFGNDFM